MICHFQLSLTIKHVNIVSVIRKQRVASMFEKVNKQFYRIYIYLTGEVPISFQCHYSICYYMFFYVCIILLFHYYDRSLSTVIHYRTCHTHQT